jgi:S1-C subfamily serine protease
MIQKRFRLPVSTGAFVIREGVPDHSAVLPGSAADVAGVREADIILEMNNTAVGEKTVIEDIIENIPLGTKISMKVLRSGEEKLLELITQERK